MNKYDEYGNAWMNDLLEAAEANPAPDVLNLIESCGKKCAIRRQAAEQMARLRQAASHCKTRTELVEFLRERIPVTILESEDGIIMYLGKKACTCPMASEIPRVSGILCNCTCGHEKFAWSVFFGKPVEVEIVESFLRGGNDCVIKIIV